MTLCVRCQHQHSTVDGVCFINFKSRGEECLCDSQSFVPYNPDPNVFVPEQYHIDVLQKMQDVTQRIKYLIEAVKEVRNMANWEFVVTCWRYFFGFKIGMTLDKHWFDRIGKEADPETLRRSRQKVCEPELEQLRNFQTRLQNTKEFSTEYWQITEELKQFWKTAKYVPDDFNLLKTKHIKENAIFEYAISELNLN